MIPAPTLALSIALAVACACLLRLGWSQWRDDRRPRTGPTSSLTHLRRFQRQTRRDTQ